MALGCKPKNREDLFEASEKWVTTSEEISVAFICIKYISLFRNGRDLDVDVILATCEILFYEKFTKFSHMQKSVYFPMKICDTFCERCNFFSIKIPVHQVFIYTTAHKFRTF